MVKVPLESKESIALVSRLDSQRYTFSAIRNESDGRSFGKGKKRVKEGVRKGIPDMCIILHNLSMCFIELKRQKPLLKNGNLGKSPSKISKEQIMWIKELNTIDNVNAKVCFGMKEAILFIIECEAS